MDDRDQVKARGRLSAAHRRLGIAFLALGILVFAGTTSASAATFTQCPPVGSNTGCGFLITIAPGGAATVAKATDPPNDASYDSQDDTLVGLQNNSGKPLNSVFLSSPQNIFGFEQDGICDPGNGGTPTTTTTPPGCGPGHFFGPTGYEGPNNTFTNIAPNKLSGTVRFTRAVPSGGSAYWGLEDALLIGQLKVPPVRQAPPTVKVTPKVPPCSANGRITLKASETGANATGIQSITYRIDNGTQHTVKASKVTVSVPNGQHKLTFSATDKAFNTSSPKTVSVKVDKINKCKGPHHVVPPPHIVEPRFTG